MVRAERLFALAQDRACILFIRTLRRRLGPPLSFEAERSIIREMTTIAGFRSQLFRAANEVHDLTPLQAQRLLEGAVALIRCMREQTGMEPNTEAPDVTNILLDIASSIPKRSEREIRNALLESADIIRLLTMILDSLDEMAANEGP
ncbi:hypothetical protein [Ensifer adhaerens]|uniref:hypothetical protein n=1 Tax=Ensifer adhaerens TaxID=106592 RepID=UPI00098FCFE5|nr:hypothetical protein [Ensifer adhaerens]